MMQDGTRPTPAPRRTKAQADRPAKGSFVVLSSTVGFPSARPTMAEAQALARRLTADHPGQRFHIWGRLA